MERIKFSLEEQSTRTRIDEIFDYVLSRDSVFDYDPKVKDMIFEMHNLQKKCPHNFIENGKCQVCDKRLD